MVNSYVSAERCESELKSEFLNTLKQNIMNANVNDPDSKLGTILQLNPNLVTPSYNSSLFEIERVHITRFSTGSHNLLIETGRFSNPRIPRELRLCSCGNGVQTLRHVLMECHIILDSINSDNLRNSFRSVTEFFNWPNFHEYLLHISKTLKIEL